MTNPIIQQMYDFMSRYHLTQSKLAALMEVSPAAVSLWFSGQRIPNTRNYIRFQILVNEMEVMTNA